MSVLPGKYLGTVRPGLRTIDTFHDNEDTAVIKPVLVIPPFSVEAEGSAVKRPNVIDLQRTVSFAQVLWHFGTVLEMVEDVALAIVVYNAPVDL